MTDPTTGNEPCARSVQQAPDPESFELPPEVWTEVFKPLSSRQLLRCRLVCRRWKDVVDGCSALRRKVSVTFRRKLPTGPRYLPPASLARFREMGIAAVGSWWSLLGQGLTDLELDSCRIELEALLGMLKETPNLKRLEFFGVKLTGELTASADLRLANVKHLYLYEIESGQILEVFRKLCCSLESLGITWDTSDDDIVSSQEIANMLVDFQDTLQEVDITGSDKILIEMIKLDRLKLKKFTLTVDDTINNEYLVELCRKHQSLEYLDIQSSPSYEISSNSKDLNEICWLLPNLKDVSLSLGLETTLMDLTNLSSLTKLQKLSIRGEDCDGCYGCCGCYDGCNRAILNFRFSQPVFCNITELLLSNIDLSVHHSEGNFERLLAMMPNLRIIDILESPIHSWPSLFRMLSPLNRLQKLSLDVYPNDKTRCYYVDDLINLRYLSLYDSKSSPELLASVLSRCPNLRELFLLVKKKAINKEVLRVICQKLTQLSDLTVSKGILSKEHETYLYENCHSLKELQIMG